VDAELAFHMLLVSAVIQQDLAALNGFSTETQALKCDEADKMRGTAKGLYRGGLINALQSTASAVVL
jgi:hypothetical protein